MYNIMMELLFLWVPAIFVSLKKNEGKGIRRRRVTLQQRAAKKDGPRIIPKE